MYITNKATKAYRRPGEGFIDNIAGGISLDGWRQNGWFVASVVNGVQKSGWYIPTADVDEEGPGEPQPTRPYTPARSIRMVLPDGRELTNVDIVEWD